MKIFAIDDLKTNLELYSEILGEEYEMELFQTPFSALARIENTVPDLIIVDCLMPGMDGHQFIAKVKAKHPHLPVIMISGYRVEENLIRAMELMADDFMFKPINFNELKARVKSKILRSKKAIDVALESNIDETEISFDDANETVRFSEKEFNLKGKEYRLLKYLVKRKNQIVSRDEIFVNVWDDVCVSPATLDTHMCQLRKKLDEYGDQIVTRKNSGFVFSTEEFPIL